LDDHVDRDNIENFPMTRYAARYWATHAQFENASSHIKDGMECLFDATKPHFATWLWIYNKDQWNGCPLQTMHPEKPEGVPLFYAAMLGFRDLAEHLITEHPEHVNAKCGRDATPMHIASQGGHASILTLLLEHGALVDDQDMFGHSPLHRASLNGKVEAGQCLLDHGADIHARNNEDRTPLFVAAFHGRVEFSRMLLERGAKINDHETRSMSPLHCAILSGSIQTVRLLLEHGADVNVRESKSGRTPSKLGLILDRHDIVELLSEYGAESVD
jgi:ankyrin